MRKRNNHRGDAGAKFKSRGGKYGGGGSGGGGGNGSRESAAKTIARATSMREKYMNLARDAMQAGDRIAAENWYQHADHYYRVIRAAQEDQEEFQRYVNRPQQEFEEEAPAEDANVHLPAFLKSGNAPQAETQEQAEQVVHAAEE